MAPLKTLEKMLGEADERGSRLRVKCGVRDVTKKDEWWNHRKVLRDLISDPFQTPA